MHRPDTRPAVGRDGRGVEGRVLDVVAHRGDVVVTEWFDVEKCAAMIEDERPVIPVVDPEPEVHELWRCADVELKAFEHVLDAVTVDSERGPDPVCVDRTRGHPFLDGDLAHHLSPEGADEMGHPAPVDHLAGQQEFGYQDGELLLTQTLIGRGAVGVMSDHQIATGGALPKSYHPPADFPAPPSRPA